jgi:hypothetical protein
MPKANIRYLLASLLVGVVATLLFTPGLPGEFIFDDTPNIINNPAIQLTQLSGQALADVLTSPQMSGTLRALPTLSFAVDYWRGGGPDPMVFKTTNLLIHALTASALAWFFRSLLLVAGVRSERAHWLALALAFAWAAHPLQVSSVLYAVQRIQTMGTLFLVLALWAYLHARHAQIQGRPGRKGLLLSALLWVVAMGCKEDSVLLPAYTLALELTVLRFAAADAGLATRLRRGYLLATLAGAAIYVLWVIPHFWQWDTLPGREFSTLERLLTQPRVLCMYLWQILVPLPGNMPFYYDWLQPSRGLPQPWTTLPAIAIVLALLGTAWRLRHHWPLFALGVFLFFANHFIASNVVGLELAFEHRNHFALIGAVLAAGSLLAHAGQRLRLPPAAGAATCAVLVLSLASATLLRSHAWRSSEGIARTGTEAAPTSGRAWVQLCRSHLLAGGGAVPGNTRLDEAIATCTEGSDMAPQSLNSPTLLILLKTLRGNATPQDWDRLQARMRTVPMTHDNARVYTILLSHKRMGVDLDNAELLESFDILLERATYGPQNLANLGYFVMHDLSAPDRALPYLLRTIEAAPVSDPVGVEMASTLRARGRPDLAKRVEMAMQERSMRAP